MTLVNRLPVATACSEARSQALAFCRKQVDTVNLCYTIEPSDGGDGIVRPILLPTTVMITHAYIKSKTDTKAVKRGFHSVDTYVIPQYEVVFLD